MKELYDDPSLYVPLESSCMTKKHVQDSFGTTLIIPAKAGGEKEVVYGKGKEFSTPDHFLEENEEDVEPTPHLFRYDTKARNLMERYIYNFAPGEGLCFGRGS